MNITIGLLTLALLPAYLCRLSVLDVGRDPAWETLGTYAAFVALIVAGTAVLQSEVKQWHVAMILTSLLWIVGTYYRWAKTAVRA